MHILHALCYVFAFVLLLSRLARNGLGCCCQGILSGLDLTGLTRERKRRDREEAMEREPEMEGGFILALM